MDFSTVYKEYQPKIQRYLTHFSGEADAADLTQAVFLKVSRSLDSFRGESSLATWIYCPCAAMGRLRGEVARQAANMLCHTLAPEKTVRICLGGAFTKDTGQRNLHTASAPAAGGIVMEESK